MPIVLYFRIGSELQLSLAIAESPICVFSLIEGYPNLCMIYKDVKISYLTIHFSCDLFVLDFEGIDDILNMDWLSEHEAVLDCRERIILFKRRMRREVEIYCQDLDRCMRSFLYELELSQVELRSILIVKNFSDVFEDVNSLPPHQAIEFRIDLIPDARPIIQPMPKMAPRERKELINLIDNLLKWGLIRPNRSSWGPAVVFVAKYDGSLSLYGLYGVK